MLVGIVIDSNNFVPENAYGPIKVILVGNVTDISDVFVKAYDDIEITPVGIVIDTIEVSTNAN